MGDEPILLIEIIKANGQSLLYRRGKSGLPMNTKPGKSKIKPGEHINPVFTDSATENNRLHLIVPVRVKTCGKSIRYVPVMVCKGKPLREQDKIGMCR